MRRNGKPKNEIPQRSPCLSRCGIPRWPTLTCEGLRLSVWVCIKSFGSWPFLRPDISCLHPLMAFLCRLQPPEETYKAYHGFPYLNNGHCVYNCATSKSEVYTRFRCRCGSRPSIASTRLLRLMLSESPIKGA